MLSVREPVNIVCLPADQDREKAPDAWKANQPLHRRILGSELVDQSIGGCDLYFNVVLKLAVCVQEMGIRVWQRHLTEPGSSLFSVETFVLQRLNGMLSQKCSYPVSKH